MKFGRRNWKTLAVVLCTIIFAINVLFSRHCTSARLERYGFQCQSFLHEGDIIVSGNEIRIIDYDYHLIGNITVKDNATLIIRNAIFNQTGLHGRVGIVVENQASFTVTDATLIISQDYTSKITLQDEAMLDIVNSNITNSNSDVYIWVRDNSTVHIENSAISGLIESKLVVETSSSVEIKNSALGRVVVWVCPEVLIESSTLTDALKTWGATTVRVLDSTIGFVWAGLGVGNVKMTIRRSSLGYIQTGSESEVWLIKTSLAAVWSGGNSKVWLIDMSEAAIHEFDNARVFIGWELPLFGPIAVHYSVAPIVRLIPLIALGAIGFVVLFVVIIKLQKGRARQAEVPDKE